MFLCKVHAKSKHSHGETVVTNTRHTLSYGPAAFQHKQLESVVKFIVSGWNILMIEQLATPMTSDNGLDYRTEAD